MEDVISLVLVAAVVAIGVAGLFGRRHARPAVPGDQGAQARPQPPAYRIVRPSGAARPPGPVRPAAAGPVAMPAEPVGVHDGATRVMPAVAPPADDEAGRAGPDPDAELIARGHPSERRRGPGDPGTAPGPGGSWTPGGRP